MARTLMKRQLLHRPILLGLEIIVQGKNYFCYTTETKILITFRLGVRASKNRQNKDK